MPAITITDLNNAKTDVDHIAAVATSLLPTATDRLGHVKPTLSAVLQDIDAAGDAKVAEVESEWESKKSEVETEWEAKKSTVDADWVTKKAAIQTQVNSEIAAVTIAKVAAQTAQGLAEGARDTTLVAKTATEAARDAALAATLIYATTAAGITATNATTNKYFYVPSTLVSESLILYLNVAGTAVEQKRYPSATRVNAVADSYTLAALPGGALCVRFADQYKATPRPHLPNALVGAPTGVSLLGPGRRRFANTTFWNPAFATLTDDGFAGPDGRAEASRLVAAASNWYLTTPTLVTIPTAGVYSLWASVKRNTGTDQTFQQKFLTASLASGVQTAGAGWSRVSFPATLPAGSQFVQPFIHNGGAACDIQICDVELFPGTVDLHEANAGHMMLGRYAGSAEPTYAAGKLDFSSSAWGYTQLLDAASLARVTAMVVVEKVAAGGTHQPFFSDMRLNSWPQFSAMTEKSAQGSFWLGGVEFVPVVGGSGLWDRLNRGVHMITCRFDGTRGEIFLDDTLMFTSAQAPTGPTISDFYNFTLNGTIFTGDKMVGDALYARALSDAEIRRAFAAFKARAAQSSIPMTGDTANRIIAFEGESLTSGDGTITSYAMRYGPNASPAVFGTNFAVGGSYIGTSSNNMQLRAAALDRIIPPEKGGRKFILSVQISNDLLNRTTAQFLTDLAAYLVARRAAGWDKIVLCTILPRTNSTFNTARNIVNPTLRTWVGTYVDAIVDFAAMATLGNDADAADTAKYGDGTHPTNASQILMEAVARPVYNAL